MRLVNWRTLVVAAAGFGLAACGDDVVVQQPPITFTTNPQSVTCTPGQPIAVGVNVSGGSGTSTVAFTPGSTTVITGGNASGSTYTFTCGASGASSVTFTITSGNQTATGSIPVNIQPAAVPVTAISISPAAVTVGVGATAAPLAATVTLSPNAPSGTSTAVRWFSDNPAIATVDSLTGAVKGVAVGATTVRAEAVAARSLTARIPVTVTNAQLVTSLTLGSTVLNLQQGATQQIAATVQLAPNAPAGTSTGVTCTSSTTSVATIAGGTTTPCSITAVGPGNSVITVRSVADTNVRQTISLTVGALAPVRLTIQSVQTVNAAGNQVAIDPSNVVGNIIATLNLDPGDNRPDSVVVTLGSLRVNCQKFTVQLQQALYNAVTSGSADFAPIQCQTINTASFDTTSGKPSVQNGSQNFSATVFYHSGTAGSGGAGTSQTATINLPLTINNQSGYFVRVTNTPSAAQTANGGPASGQAPGPQGVTWRAGTLNVSVIPVFFAQQPAGSGTQTISVSLVDANGTIATQTSSEFTPGAATGGTGTATFAGTTGAYTPNPGNGSITGYTSPNAGQPQLGTQGGTAGTQIQIGGGANTIVLNASGTPLQGGPVVFIDNAYPEPRPQFVSNNFLINNTATGFLNASFTFADSVVQGAQQTALADNNGVDRVQRQFFVATNAAGISAADIISGGTSTTNGSQLAQNVSATQYAAAVKLTDALGNAVPVPVTALNGGPLFTFGVITAPPTLAINTGTTNISNNSGLGLGFGAGPGVIEFNVSTTSGASFPTNYIVGTLQVTNASGTFCATQADVTNGTLAGVSSTGTTPPCPTISFNRVSIDPATARTGIYTLTYQARDIAGNLSTSATRTFVVDRNAPVVVNANIATPPLTGGQTESFTAQATDDFALVSQNALVEYPTASNVPTPAIPEVILRYNGTAIGNQFAAPFTRTANLNPSVDFFIRGLAMQAQTAANQFVTVNNQSFITPGMIAVGASDAGGNWGYDVISQGAINNALDQTQPTPSFFGGNGPQSVSLTFQASNASSATTGGFAGTLASATSGTPTSLTVNVVQNGQANTPFSSAFNRVEIWTRSNVPGQNSNANQNPFNTATGYTRQGTCSAAVLSVSTTSSTITNSCSITPGTNGIPAFGTSATSTNVLIIASDANGYAIGFVIPTITINP